MPPRFSLIISTRDAHSPRLAWHRGQVNADTEVVIIENAGRCGLGQAYNEGLAQACGEFVCFMHDDVEISTTGWRDCFATGVEEGGYDLLGIAGSQVLPMNGVWWAAPDSAVRGEVWHRISPDTVRQDRYGAADDPIHGLSPVVSLDGLLLFGRRVLFLETPFDTDFFDGFHFYDSDLCLRWLTRHNRRLGVLHGLRVIHDSSGAIDGISAFQERFFFRFGGFLPLDLNGVATWRRNLETLRLFAPTTAALLTSDRPPGAVYLFEQRPDGSLWALRTKGDVLLTDPDYSQVPHGILLGAGDGTLVRQALASGIDAITVVEPEGHLLLRLLSRQDLSTALANGQLRLRVPMLDHPVLMELSLQELIAEWQQRDLSGSPPVMWESGSLELGFDLFRALQAVPERLTAVHQAAAARPLATVASFDITVVSPRCAIFDDLAQGFSNLGLRVRLYRVPDEAGVWNKPQRLAALQDLREEPALVTLLRNRSLIETENPRSRIPWEAFLPGRLVSWWWDVPNVASAIDLEALPASWPAFAFARDLLPKLPPGSSWLPPGARSAFNTDPGPDEPELPEPIISFVGQSRYALLIANLQTLAQMLGLLRGRIGMNLANDINRISGPIAIYRYLRDHEWELRQVLNGLSRKLPMPAYYLQYLLDMSLTGAFRIAGVALLAQHGLPIRVYGDTEWLRTGAISPVQFRGPIELDALPALYRRSQINLNLNFMQVSSTVNPKVLDICAAGGTVLTDYRPEIEWLYPDPAQRPFYFERLETLPAQAIALLGRDLSAHRTALQSHTRAHHMLQHRARWIAEQLGLL